ncbi:MAG: hypothetical protein ACOX4R_02425 [Lentihominibacter sp.]|jgi:hypothetical protein
MNILSALNNNKMFKNTVKIICIAAMLVMMVISVGVYKADVGVLAIFAFFCIIYVQLPGLFILKLVKVCFSHISTTLCAGFFTGWLFVVLQYFITELIHTNILLYVLGPIFTIIYIYSLLRDRNNRNRTQFSFTGLSTTFCIFAAIVLLYALTSTQYLYMNPENCVLIYTNPDRAYHMGLINSLSHGWPLESPWVQGRIIKYHVFTELLMAVPVRLFGVTADAAMLSFNPIMTTYVFGLSTYVFFIELSGRPKRAGVYSLTVMLSNLFLVRTFHTSMAYHFAIINDNSAGYGIGGAMLMVVLFRNWHIRYSKGSRICWKELLLLTALVMMLTGIKGPIALVLVGAVWGTFVIGLILRKLPAKTILPILIITAGFLLTYITILSGKGMSNASGDSIFALATMADISFFRDELVLFLKELGLPKIIRLGIIFVVFMIFMLTAYVLPFTIGYIRELILIFSGRKEYDFTRVLVYAAFLVGLTAMLIMNYSGHSQVYFGLVSVFFAPLITFWFFEDMSGNKGILMNVVRGIFLVCLVLTTITLVLQFEVKFKKAQIYANPDTQHNTYMSISRPEYEAMRWIDENTPKDSLLATDRYASVPMEQYSYRDRWNNRFFLYAVYSNRFCYIAGSGYNLPAGDWVIRREMIEMNNQFYDVDNPDRGKLAREVGIDYLVVSKRFNDFGNLSGKGYSLCFTNEDIDIYKLK